MKTRLTCLLLCTAFLLSAVWAGDKDPAKGKSEEKKEAISLTSAAVPTAITWHKYDVGLRLAKKTGKKIFLEFTAKWCGYCKRMHATTFKDPEVIAMLDKYFISISVDGESFDTLNVDGWITNGRGLTKEYKVTGYPTYWLMTPALEKIAPVVGYRPKEALYDILDYLKDDTYKTASFAEFMNKRKKDKEPSSQP